MTQKNFTNPNKNALCRHLFGFASSFLAFIRFFRNEDSLTAVSVNPRPAIFDL
jgi:hypothetical protein